MHRLFIGQSFAVKLNADERDKGALVRAGTLGLNCSPNFVPPAGFRSERMIDGCVLTGCVE
ncbi:hypothetical protein [Streptomyces tailanensis]|uniref:hypothetical protein n=1 Tax=Streptomyces tailanensis TaxID=2569858 RepID=UPI00122E91D4|nr:hypothetical protein [Streptomyces tailanensis]